MAEEKRDADRAWRPSGKEQTAPLDGVHAIPLESEENTNL